MSNIMEQGCDKKKFYIGFAEYVAKRIGPGQSLQEFDRVSVNAQRMLHTRVGCTWIHECHHSQLADSRQSAKGRRVNNAFDTSGDGDIYIWRNADDGGRCF